MRIKSPKKVELPEKFVKLMEEAYIVAKFINPPSVEYNKERIRREEPIVHITSLLLAAIDDVNKGGSPTVPWLFRHASSKEYLKRAKEFLGEEE